MRPIPPQDRVGLLLTSAVFGLSVLVLPAHPLVTRTDPATRPTPVLMAAAVPQLLPLLAPDPAPASPAPRPRRRSRPHRHRPARSTSSSR